LWQGRFRSVGKVFTTLEPLGPWYRAEEYHQKYFAKNY
jgi:peptide-methionine (S)-S-oxide reductase